MKRFLILLSLLFCNVVFADTINLHWLNEDGTVYENSTCVIDSDLILPSTPPTKYGYTFTGWKITSYVPVEYLESTGTQYIDTKVVPSSTTVINVSVLFNVIPSDENTYVFGSRSSGDYQSSTDQFYIAVSKTACVLRSGIGSELLCQNPIENTKHNFLVTNSRSTTTGTYYITLFALNYRGNILHAKPEKIYYMKIYDNGTIVRDFIPVLDANGTPCMLDRVTEQFFYNQGTGDFIAGPVVN